MSVAIANTQSRIGQRTIGAYRARNIYRSPAEPMPRSAMHPVHGLGVIAAPISEMIRVNEAAPIPLVGGPALNANGTASQNPTGVAIAQNQPLNTTAVATQQAPAVTPASVAVITPSATPGYVTISSGGGTVANPSPNYVDSVTNWLSETTLLAPFGLTLPNYLPLLGAALLLGMVWKDQGGRR